VIALGSKLNHPQSVIYSRNHGGSISEKERLKNIMSQHTVKMSVNGEAYELTVPFRRLLLDSLREDLGLTGTKEGCGIGVCGSCTVLVDGDMITSCLTPAVFADGCEVTTIEGLADGDELHPLQRAFLEHGGLQCGFCTPGQIMAAKALLDSNPMATEQDVKDWMVGNLCRCTGYYKIIESILAAGAKMRNGVAS
jgi:carbon-monoxide dehydrogenase small subunit